MSATLIYMHMHEKEEAIQRQRTVDATLKNLMGMNGKFGTILKYLGQPIIAHGYGMFEQTELTDYWELDDEKEDKLETMSEDELTSEVGTHFDGLNMGVHLEIKHILERKELQVTYKGYLVYSEIGGELDCYVPMKEWEDEIERLYAVAKNKEGVKRQEIKQENKEQFNREKLGFLDKLRRRWGI